MTEAGSETGVVPLRRGAPAAAADEGRGPRTRVLVLSPLRFFAEALAAELSRHAHLDARGWSVADPRAPADVLLVDVHSRGLDVLRQARDRFAGCPIVALGVDERPEQVIACVEAGAIGYVRKDAILEELVAAVERASRGEAVCSPAVVGELFRRVAGLAHEVALDPVVTELLTPREHEIAVLVSRGFTNKAIARQLGLRIPTVKSHVHQVLRKLGLSSRVSLLAAVRRDPELFRTSSSGAADR